MSKLHVDKDKASRILADVPPEKAFHFHTDVNLYTGKYASNLVQFSELLREVEMKSIEFHVRRKDFENWLKYLGDYVLAMQIARLRSRKLTGEELRTKILQTVKRRCDKLKALL